MLIKTHVDVSCLVIMSQKNKLVGYHLEAGWNQTDINFSQIKHLTHMGDRFILTNGSRTDLQPMSTVDWTIRSGSLHLPTSLVNYMKRIGSIWVEMSQKSQFTVFIWRSHTSRR